MNFGHETTVDTFLIEKSDNSAKQFNTNSTYYYLSPTFDDKTGRNLNFDKAFESCNSDNNNQMNTSRRPSQCLRGRGYEFIGRKLRQSVAVKRLSVSNQSSEYLDGIDFEDDVLPSKPNFEESSKKLSFSSTKHRKDSENDYDSRFNLDEDSVGSFRRRSYTSSYTRSTEIVKESDGVTKKPNMENGLDFANEVLKVLDPPASFPSIQDTDETTKLADSFTRKSYKPISFSEMTTTSKRKSDYENNNFELKDKIKPANEHGEDQIMIFPHDKKNRDSITNQTFRDNITQISRNLTQSDIYDLHSFVTNIKPDAMEGAEIMKMLKKLLEEIEKISRNPKICHYKPTGELKTVSKSVKDYSQKPNDRSNSIVNHSQDNSHLLQKPSETGPRLNSKNVHLGAGLNDDHKLDFRNKDPQTGHEKRNSIVNNTDPNTAGLQHQKVELKKNYNLNDDHQAKHQNPNLTSNTAHGVNTDHLNFPMRTFSNENKDHGQTSKEPLGYYQNGSPINHRDFNHLNPLANVNQDSRSTLSENFYLDTMDLSTLQATGRTGDPRMNNSEILDKFGIQRANNDFSGKPTLNTLSNLPNLPNYLNQQESISKLLQPPGLSQLDPQTLLDINKLVDNKNLFYEHSLKDIPLSFLINYLEDKLSHARHLSCALPKAGQSRYNTDILMGNERNRFSSRYDDIIPDLRIRDRIPNISKRSIAENNEYLRRLMNCRKSETRFSSKFPDQKSKDKKVEFKGTPEEMSKEYSLQTYNSGVQTDYVNSPRLTKTAYSQCTDDSVTNPKCSSDKSFDQSFQKCAIQSSEVISPTSPCTCQCRIHPHKRSNNSRSKYSCKEHKSFEITCPKHDDDDDDTEQLMMLCRKYLDKKQCSLSHKTTDCSGKHSDTCCQSENFRIFDKLNNQIPIISPSIPNIPSIETHNCSPIHLDNKCPTYSNSLLFSNSPSVRDFSNKYSDIYRSPNHTFINPCHKYYYRNDKSPTSFSSNCYGNNDNKSRHVMNNYDSDKLPNKTLYLRALQNNLSRSIRSPCRQENLLDSYFNKFPLKRNNCVNVDDISASYRSSETNGEKRREFLQMSLNKDIPKFPNREIKNKTYHEYVRCNNIRNQPINDYQIQTAKPYERELNQDYKIPQFIDNKQYYNRQNSIRCSPDSVKINKCCSTSLEDVSKQSIPQSRQLLFKRSKNIINNQRHMYKRFEDCHNIKSRNFSKALSNESSPISSDNSVTRKGYFANQNFIRKDEMKKSDKIIQTHNTKDEEIILKIEKSNEETTNNYSTEIKNKIPEVQQPVTESHVNKNKQLSSEEVHIPVIVKKRGLKNIQSENYLKKPEAFQTKHVNSINVSLSDNLNSHDWSTLSQKENTHEYVQFQDASSSLVTQLPAKHHQSNYVKTFINEASRPRLDSNKCFSNIHNTSETKTQVDSKLLNREKHKDFESQSRDNRESIIEDPKKPQELLNLSERVSSKSNIISNKSQGTQFSEYSMKNLHCQSFVRKKFANNFQRISNLNRSQCDNSYPYHSANTTTHLQKGKRSFLYSGKIPPMYNQRKIVKPSLPDSKQLEILTTLEKDISLKSKSIARRISMATQTLSISECSLSQSDISYCSEMISTSSDDNYCFPCDPRYDFYD